jgi:putative PIN family toxin of toxin-antitoxin system
MRVVADSNIYVSALVFGGKPEAFLRAAESGRCKLFISEVILSEIAEVLVRKFVWERERVSGALERIRAAAFLTLPTAAISACEDPDDDRILEAAVGASAQCIVSGDRHLLRMQQFWGIEIIPVTNFLGRLDEAIGEQS